MGRKCEVVILVGSAQRKSTNAGLVNEIQKFVIERGLELRLVIPSLDGLPIFDEDIENAFSTVCAT
jgi:NAD(P)H-dependent FMN reductase